MENLTAAKKQELYNEFKNTEAYENFGEIFTSPKQDEYCEFAEIAKCTFVEFADNCIEQADDYEEAIEMFNRCLNNDGEKWDEFVEMDKYITERFENRLRVEEIIRKFVVGDYKDVIITEANTGTNYYDFRGITVRAADHNANYNENGTPDIDVALTDDNENGISVDELEAEIERVIAEKANQVEDDED